jgi:hypothetical protein
MADKRAFAQFDVGYLDNPKIMEVFDASPIAVCMHIASVLYCAQHLTDGEITSGPMQRKTGGTAADTKLLVDNDLWHLPGHDCEFCPQPPQGKVYVHDYTEHNRTSEGVKRAAEAGKRGAAGRWGKKQDDANRNANRMRSAYEPQCDPHSDVQCDPHSDVQCDSDEIAMPRERERKREKEEAKASSPEIPRPDIDKVIQGFSELLDANDIRHKPGQSWHTATRLLIDKDGYTPDQIMYVARFATTDEFWKSNILSIPKLREKFEALKIKAQGQGQQSRPTASQVRLQAGLELLQRTAARTGAQQPMPYQTEIED